LFDFGPIYNHGGMLLDGEVPREPINFIKEIVSFISWLFPWFFLGIAFDHEYQDA
jgi:hypothetical protein